ncbi:hypothetical protein GCM10019995_09540 [Lactobacillus kefiranofaciens subsp. kefirgranum]
MSQAWFEQYVYDVIVKKEFLPKELQKLVDQPAIDVMPWDNFGE